MSNHTNSPHPSTQEQHSESPAPSANPATAAPIPGPRASRLQQVYDHSLARTLRANSYANFSGCFPTPARHVPSSLESVWRQLNTKLEESARAEFEDIIHERNAVGQLNELDRLVSEAKQRMGEEGEQNGEVIVYVFGPGFVVFA